MSLANGRTVEGARSTCNLQSLARPNVATFAKPHRPVRLSTIASREKPSEHEVSTERLMVKTAIFPVPGLSRGVGRLGRRRSWSRTQPPSARRSARGVSANDVRLALSPLLAPAPLRASRFVGLRASRAVGAESTAPKIFPTCRLAGGAFQSVRSLSSSARLFVSSFPRLLSSSPPCNAVVSPHSAAASSRSIRARR